MLSDMATIVTPETLLSAVLVGRKNKTLDDFFHSQLVSLQRKRIKAVCADMWEAFRFSIGQWAPQCKIIYDKFHIIQHANDSIDEVRRAEFFRQGPRKRGLIKGENGCC